MPDKKICLEGAKKIDPAAVLCDDSVCTSPPVRDAIYLYCHCKPPYTEQKPCPFGPNDPVPIYAVTGVCFCCCSCFAWNTPIAVPEGESENGFKVIQSFRIGDNVMAAGKDLKWKAYCVEHSDGIPPSPEHGKTMMTVYFKRDNKVSSLVVTPDHVFLLADGKLKRAEKLVPGNDKLVSDTGTPVDILGLEIGGWYGGVHHISTSETVATSIEGHLLNSNGIVTGDWALQISNIVESEPGVKLSKATPEFNIATKGYLAAHKHLKGNMFSVSVKNVNLDAARPKEFRPYKTDSHSMPKGVKRFITEQQAKDILYNAKQEPVTSNAGKDIVYYLFKLMGGFYPDIHFGLVWEEMLPNAYSWEQYGVKFVVVNGGLIRTEGVGFNEMALILAHEIGHLIGGAPYEQEGIYSCEGQADYVATSAILCSVFFPNMYQKIVLPGIEGIANFFNFIDEEHRKGNPGDKCCDIATDCRISAFKAGLGHSALPECAGGSNVDYLEIVSAIAIDKKDATEITVKFNQPIDLNSAVPIENYRFDPKAGVLKVDTISKKADSVLLTATLEQKKSYKLFISNVISKQGVSFKGGVGSVAVTWSE